MRQELTLEQDIALKILIERIRIGGTTINGPAIVYDGSFEARDVNVALSQARLFLEVCNRDESPRDADVRSESQETAAR